MRTFTYTNSYFFRTSCRFHTNQLKCLLLCTNCHNSKLAIHWIYTKKIFKHTHKFISAAPSAHSCSGSGWSVLLNYGKIFNRMRCSRNTFIYVSNAFRLVLNQFFANSVIQCICTYMMVWYSYVFVCNSFSPLSLSLT